MSEQQNDVRSTFTMNIPPKNDGGFRVWGGILLIVIGGGLLLDAVNVFEFGDIFDTWWPSILMIIAIAQISTRKSGYTGPFILFGIGAILQASELGILPGGFWSAFWPLVLVAIGLSMLLGRKKKVAPLHGSNDIPIPDVFGAWSGAHADDVIDRTAVFSGQEIYITSKSFRGGNVSAVFSGIELDLRNAEIHGDTAVLRLTAVMAAIELRVPPHWNVTVKGSPFLGGIDDRTVKHTDANVIGPTLVVDANAILGGIEIRT